LSWCTEVYIPCSFQGTANPNFQAGPPGTGSIGHNPSQAGSVPPKMPQVLAPTPASMGFMPINSSGVQRPGMGPPQPPSPTQPAQVQPAITPAAPPPTVQTADTSNVPGNYLFVKIIMLNGIMAVFAFKGKTYVLWS